jgi:hypothetical protein
MHLNQLTNQLCNDVLLDCRSSRHRWQLAWALTWPSFLFDFLLWLVTVRAVRHYLDEQSAEMIHNICKGLFFFLIPPWVIRRTMRLNFPDFHLVAIRRPGSGETRAISYRESLCVAWLFSWRTAAAKLFLLLGATFLAAWAFWGLPPDRFLTFRVLSSVPGSVELVVGNLLTLLLFYLWLVPAAIRKTYSDFVLQLREGNGALRLNLSLRTQLQ